MSETPETPKPKERSAAATLCLLLGATLAFVTVGTLVQLLATVGRSGDRSQLDGLLRVPLFTGLGAAAFLGFFAYLEKTAKKSAEQALVNRLAKKR